MALDRKQEFDFSLQDFNQVRKHLIELTGISLADSKDSMVYSRLARRLRALKISTFAEYLRYLNNTPVETEQFINALTTNLTSFFREPHHFDILKNHLTKYPRHHTIWCSAASTGEEPYSIAIAAAEAFGRLDPPVNIIATDIDSQVLKTAQTAIYPIKNVESVDPGRRKRFFYKGAGANEGKAKVIPELTKLIEYKKLNLLDHKWDIPNNLDIIFCRNVMIYFDKPTQIRVLEKMVKLMRPSGLYFAGHSENFNHMSKILSHLGKTVYRPAR